MKKATRVTVLSTLLFSLTLVPAITTQAITLPFISSIYDTIQSYSSIANAILSSLKLTTAELAASKNTVSDPSIYGVAGADTSSVAPNPLDAEGEINFDATADDSMAALFADKAETKNRSIGEFQGRAELATYETATRAVGIASKKANERNSEVVNAAQTAMAQARELVSSQPIGTCDSSLCAENTNNLLIAQQINLQSAAISLSIMSNAYSSINNKQQAILVKNEQDNKAKEVVKERFNSIDSGSGLRNRFNANQLIRTAYKSAD